MGKNKPFNVLSKKALATAFSTVALVAPILASAEETVDISEIIVEQDGKNYSIAKTDYDWAVAMGDFSIAATPINYIIVNESIYAKDDYDFATASLGHTGALNDLLENGTPQTVETIPAKIVDGEVEVVVLPRDGDVFHIENPTLEDMKIMVEEIGDKLRGVLSNGAYPTKDDFSTLVDALKQYATDDYIYDELKPYYEEHVHSTIDIHLFPFVVEPDLVFDILEAQGNRLLVQTVERENGTAGRQISYTFKYENGRWLVDDYQSISLDLEPLPALTVKEVEHYLSKYYSKLHGNRQVNVTYVDTGTKEIYNYYTGRDEKRTYYRYRITRSGYEYVIDFFIHNGLIDYVE